ncbi:MAG: tetratricopeptide repeat protein [Peptoniphilus sp.]|nr:tetratricopeptide repeat protein [Peptoniphilus sp.]MDY3118500.1 tetratricopeptide repeat protein [Peptoniphilus sp.]
MDSKKYFADWYDAIGFLEQRPDRPQILDGAPIPMLQKHLVQAIKNQRADDTMDYRHIFIAMCIVVALDECFPYADVYLKFLKDNEKDAVAAIDYQLALAVQKNAVEEIYLFARAKECIRNTTEAKLETTYAMEGIYNKHWDGGIDLSDLLKEIMDRYEGIIEKEPDSAEAYSALGRIYEAQGLYIKAKFHDEKALALAKDDLLKDRLRQAIDRLNEPAAIDGAKTYLHYGKYDEAIQMIQTVQSKEMAPDVCAHILGMAYYGLGEYEKAVFYLQEAASHGTDGEIENNLAIALAAADRTDEAIDILSDLLLREEDNRTAYMNRGILYYRREEFKRALCDFESAYRLGSDPELWALIEQTKERADNM